MLEVTTGNVMLR